ncbi:hypothetical protein QE422_001865 [Chryseobacterium sp. SORGH_AS 447]|nr:hypothetical protein [Chryseobacterium sp. SORGH_AS_0447]
MTPIGNFGYRILTIDYTHPMKNTDLCYIKKQLK